jgi:hypothetical protein
MKDGDVQTKDITSSGLIISERVNTGRIDANDIKCENVNTRNDIYTKNLYSSDGIYCDKDVKITGNLNTNNLLLYGDLYGTKDRIRLRNDLEFVTGNKTIWATGPVLTAKRVDPNNSAGNWANQVDLTTSLWGDN